MSYEHEIQVPPGFEYSSYSVGQTSGPYLDQQLNLWYGLPVKRSDGSLRIEIFVLPRDRQLQAGVKMLDWKDQKDIDGFAGNIALSGDRRLRGLAYDIDTKRLRSAVVDGFIGYKE